MNNTFYTQMHDLSLRCRSGMLALITHADDPQLIGQKAFLGSVHPLCEQPSLGDFWERFFSSLAPQEESLPCTVAFEGCSVFVERLSPKPQLVILGGGHVAYAVYQLGCLLGFSITVVDDREEFCNAQRFPNADTLCLPFAQALEQLPCDRSTYYVIVTRGHQHDYECLAHLLRQPQGAYLGMIGSRRKRGLVHQALLEEGFTQEQIDTVHSPIGLAIGAQTPEEIAVSIFAEIIQVKSSHHQDSCLEDPALEMVCHADGPVALCTVIRKTGSIPRGAGSKMAVDQSGRTCGSVGGGKIEFDAICMAKKLCETQDPQPIVTVFEMDNLSAQDDGMICGGSAEVLIQLVK